MNNKLKELSRKKEKLQALLKLKPQDFQDQLNEWVRVELTYSSNFIEGNTLTRQQTAEVIERGMSAIIKGKSLKEQLEALNHANAVNLIRNITRQIKGHQFISEGNIKNIHKTILTGIDDYNAGNYRHVEVFIRGAGDVVFPQPNQVPVRMRQLIEWLEGQQKSHPVTVAADFHSKFVTIHPFIDGNGRTGRLLMNLVLLFNDYPLAIIRAEERQEYLESIYALQIKKNNKNYYALIYRAVERSLDAYINLAQGKPALTPFGDISGLLKIGEVASNAGVAIPTVRYYVNESLIKPIKRSKGNFMLFEPSVVKTIQKIKKLQKDKRLSIAEIKKEFEKKSERFR